jgi:serine protease Do
VDDAIAESLGLGKVRGALVAGVDDKGPAKTGGLKTGDVIVKFDGKEVKQSRDLPKIVAQSPVGKDVEVIVMRDGKEVPATVRLGRLEDGEKQASLGSKNDAKPESSPVQAALGMKFATLNDETRLRFSIKDSVKNGVVVTEVDPASNAAEKRVQRGEIIVEINQEPVKNAGDVARRIKALKDGGKKSALLLVANAQGEVRFVPVQIE